MYVYCCYGRKQQTTTHLKSLRFHCESLWAPWIGNTRPHTSLGILVNWDGIGWWQWCYCSALQHQPNQCQTLWGTQHACPHVQCVCVCFSHFIFIFIAWAGFLCLSALPVLAHLPSSPSYQQPSTVWWVPGGPGRPARPPVAWAAQRGAARCPCPRGTGGHPVLTSGSGGAAMATTLCAARLKVWWELLFPCKGVCAC